MGHIDLLDFDELKVALLGQQLYKNSSQQLIGAKSQPHSQAFPTKEGECLAHFIMCVMSRVGTRQTRDAQILPMQFGARDRGKYMSTMQNGTKTAGYSSRKSQCRRVQQIFTVCDVAPYGLNGMKFCDILCFKLAIIVRVVNTDDIDQFFLCIADCKTKVMH